MALDRTFARGLATVALAGLASPALAQVSVTDAWVRGTVAPQTSSAAYMTLRASQPMAVVAAASPFAKQAAIHEMTMDGGVMRMRSVPALPLPADKSVALVPNGYHVMLTGLLRPLKEGEKVPIVLTLKDAGGKQSTLAVEALVRPLTAGSHTGH
ncbi:MAG: copper chaperone PCu(A)C [Casimicrobiaceae bacterium]